MSLHRLKHQGLGACSVSTCQKRSEAENLAKHLSRQAWTTYEEGILKKAGIKTKLKNYWLSIYLSVIYVICTMRTSY